MIELYKEYVQRVAEIILLKLVSEEEKDKDTYSIQLDKRVLQKLEWVDGKAVIHNGEKKYESETDIEFKYCFTTVYSTVDEIINNPDIVVEKLIKNFKRFIIEQTYSTPFFERGDNYGSYEVILRNPIEFITRIIQLTNDDFGLRTSIFLNLIPGYSIKISKIKNT